MSGQAEQASWSRKLAAVVALLALPPPLLVYPLFRLYLLWVAPMIDEAYRQCPSDYDCPTGVLWIRVGGLLVLGLPFLIALASCFMGSIGITPSRRHRTSRANARLFWASLVLGALWACPLGVVLMFWIAWAGLVI